MPIAQTVDRDLRLAYLRGTGCLTGPELVAAYRAYLSDPAWEPHFHVLWDLRRADEIDMRWTDVEQAVDFTLEHGDRFGPGMIAFVVFRDADFDAADTYPRIIGLLGRRHPGRRVEVYGSLAEAAHRLGLSVNALPALSDEGRAAA